MTSRAVVGTCLLVLSSPFHTPSILPRGFLVPTGSVLDYLRFSVSSRNFLVSAIMLFVLWLTLSCIALLTLNRCYIRVPPYVGETICCWYFLDLCRSRCFGSGPTYRKDMEQA